MSKLYVTYSLLFILLLGGNTIKLQAQSADLVLGVADDIFEREDYYAAIVVYKKAMLIDSNNVEVLYKYGKCLTAINNNKLGSRYLKKALALDQRKVFVELPFGLAEAYRSSGKYKQAKRYYNRALRPYRTDRDGYWYKKISISKQANEWAYKKASNGFTRLKNLGSSVNSDFAEFGASISEGKLYFSAMIADSIGLGNVINDAHFYSRIYQKSLNDKNPGELLEFDRKASIIIENKHVSNPSLFQDKIFFSVCDTNFKCEIWSGNISNRKVSNIKKLNKNINTTTSNNTQAQVILEENELVMYFASDRNQGFGGLDIWKSNLESFGFGKAVNLGNDINSPDNEITPFYDVTSRTLFFSSNWHIGFGGYDVFQSKLERKVFQPAENLGTKVNSNFNEYYFQPYKQLAILSSNRVDGNVENESSCCNDLYETGFLREEAEPEVEIIKIDEEALNKFLPLSLYFHNDSPDPNSKDTSTTSNYIKLAKNYLNLKASYLQAYLPSLANSERKEAEIALSNFFDIDMKDGAAELDKITPLLLEELGKGHELTLSIRGFASSLSNSDYNLNLTLRRIQS
ncbi:MAG: tetratricopeptide repeat protein [Flavobacteriales bacterium]|nr:tetratricopeptide repeat protein [Flavobacteriales bacterium]